MIMTTLHLRSRYSSLLIISLLLGACTEPLLNSERIQQQFGSYHVEVLESSANRRLSNLYSLEDERKICRTLALVTFNDPGDARIALEQRQITAGGSIGAVFKSHDWTINKTTLYLGAIEADRNAASIASLMDIAVPTELALHVYRFELHKDNERIDYAIIAEIHHPDYLSPARLREMYAGHPSETLRQPSLALIQADLQQLMQP